MLQCCTCAAKVTACRCHAGWLAGGCEAVEPTPTLCRSVRAAASRGGCECQCLRDGPPTPSDVAVMPWLCSALCTTSSGGHTHKCSQMNAVYEAQCNNLAPACFKSDTWTHAKHSCASGWELTSRSLLETLGLERLWLWGAPVVLTKAAQHTAQAAHQDASVAAAAHPQGP